MDRPLGTYVPEEPSAPRRIFDIFFSLFLSCAVLVSCSAFYRYGENLEQRIKVIEEDIVIVEGELHQMDVAARVIRQTREQDKALDQKLAKAHKLKRRKR